MIGTVQARWKLKYLGRVIEDCVALPTSGSRMATAGARSAATRRRRRPAQCGNLKGGIEWHAKRRCRAGENIKELTVRGIILGALITVVFTAANVYLGLKIGLTFATSIPAAVISMAVLQGRSAIRPSRKTISSRRSPRRRARCRRSSSSFPAW